MPRRKPGALVALETEILDAAVSMATAGTDEFHGFGIADALRGPDGSKALTGHGTLYKALARLEDRGLLTSRWEDPATVQGRPPRRLYRVTASGREALARAAAGTGAGHARRDVPGTAGAPA